MKDWNTDSMLRHRTWTTATQIQTWLLSRLQCHLLCAAPLTRAPMYAYCWHLFWNKSQREKIWLRAGVYLCCVLMCCAHVEDSLGNKINITLHPWSILKDTVCVPAPNGMAGWSVRKFSKTPSQLTFEATLPQGWSNANTLLSSCNKWVARIWMKIQAPI